MPRIANTLPPERKAAIQTLIGVNVDELIGHMDAFLNPPAGENQLQWATTHNNAIRVARQRYDTANAQPDPSEELEQALDDLNLIINNFDEGYVVNGGRRRRQRRKTRKNKSRRHRVRRTTRHK
jgi:hypothetical protein